LSLAQPDLGVLRKAQRGDERAFSLILRAYETPVFNYVLRLVGGDRALAEDLTQEVFLRVYQGLPKFSLRSKFTTWLFQVTKNRVLDELRASERRPRALVAIDDIAPLEVLDAPIEQLEEIDTLWRAVEDLNPDLKMALLLRDVVGLSYTEIADALEITLATVKWRIYKAREEVQLGPGRQLRLRQADRRVLHLVGALDETSAEPPERAARPDAASSVAPVASGYAHSLRLASERPARPVDERIPTSPR
jgi:RNA polymerase sigma-70 factor (ECF subfamily)